MCMLMCETVYSTYLSIVLDVLQYLTCSVMQNCVMPSVVLRLLFELNVKENAFLHMTRSAI